MTRDPEQAAARAVEVIAPWIADADVIGAYLTGSATRPHADEHSDLDIIVVVEDAYYEALTPGRRHKTGIDRGPPRRKEYDLLVSPWSQLQERAASRLDHLHFYDRYIRVLYDPSGRVTEMIRQISELPDAFRAERIRVHYFEYHLAKGKIAKFILRGQRASAQMLAVSALDALTRCLFIAAGSWVAKAGWTSQELRAAGVPDAVMQQLDACWEDPAALAGPALDRVVGEWLTSLGIDVHRNVIELMSWGVQPDGLAALQRWSRA